MSEIPLRDLDTNKNLEKCRLSTTLWSQAVDALRKIKQGVDVGLKALDAQQAGRCVLCNENLGDANSSKVYKFSSPTFPINKHLSSRERLERGLSNDYVFFTVDVRVPICSDCVVRANNDQLAYDAKIKRTNRRCDALLKFRTYTIAVLALVAGAVTFVFANWYLSLLAMGAIVWLCDKVIPEPCHYFKHGLTPLESHQKAVDENPYSTFLMENKFHPGDLRGVHSGHLSTSIGYIDTSYTNHRIEV